jgi:hypothetical protein
MERSTKQHRIWPKKSSTPLQPNGIKPNNTGNNPKLDLEYTSERRAPPPSPSQPATPAAKVRVRAGLEIWKLSVALLVASLKQ